MLTFIWLAALFILVIGAFVVRKSIKGPQEVHHREVIAGHNQGRVMGSGDD